MNEMKWNRPCNFYYETNISLFVFSEHYDLPFGPCWQNTYSKLKVETLYWYADCDCAQSQQ